MHSNTQNEGKIANKNKLSTSQISLAAVKKKFSKNGKDESTLTKFTD